MSIWLRLGEEEAEQVRAERVGPDRARLLEIPVSDGATIFDIVRYDPASAQAEREGSSYSFLSVVEPSGYRPYLLWAILHRPAEFDAWRAGMESRGLVVQPAARLRDGLRHLLIALPPALSALGALVLFNRHAPTVEIVCPLLAAHADDLDRARSDLERAVAWGGRDAELTYALAEAFEAQSQWDAAVTFWERLAHTLPSFAAARERLALSYAHLGVFPLAAAEFDRAAELTADATHRARLHAARDLMWDRSRL